MNDSNLVKSSLTDRWSGRWKGHLVIISDDLVTRIRDGEMKDDEALLVGPDGESPGNWIATTIPDGWVTVPQVRVWYHYEDFVTYVKQKTSADRVPDANLLRGSGQPVRRKPPFTDRIDPPVECAACAEGEALANGKHVIDTGIANSGVVQVRCPVSRAEFNEMFGVRNE